MSRLAELRETLGFDKTKPSPHGYSVGCSQCLPLVINGVPTHEANCPNASYECRGCNARVRYRRTFCAECS